MTAGPPAPRDGRPRAWPVVHNVLRGLLGAALLVLVILIVLRLTGPGTPAVSTPTAATPSPSATPTASETPSPTPSTTPSASPSRDADDGDDDDGGPIAPKPGPSITSYTGPSTVQCPPPSEAPDSGLPAPEPPTVSLSWTSTGADQAWFGINTSNAQAEPYSAVGVNDSIAISFPCPTGSQTYTITVAGNGTSVSKSIQVKNVGYVG